MNKKRKVEINTKLASIYIEEMFPSNGQYPDIIEKQFQFRKNNIFSNENLIAIADMGEAIWWNRPQIENTDQAWGIHSDGLPCCNLPIFLGKNMVWKSEYNVLLNKHNIPTIIQIKFDKELTENEWNEIKKMSFSVISRTLLRLGVVETDLCVINNDLLLRGKKFSGSEQIIKRDLNIFTECLFVTLKYSEEKELFDKLTCGKVSATALKQITGLIDEYPEITKEKFLEIYCEEFKKYLEELNF